MSSICKLIGPKHRLKAAKEKLNKAPPITLSPPAAPKNKLKTAIRGVLVLDLEPKTILKIIASILDGTND